MRVALVQLNPVVGAVEQNTERILRALQTAREAGAALAVFPEQAILGYPAKDLLLRRDVIERNMQALQRIAVETQDIAALVGYAELNDGPVGRPLFNSGALLAGGRVQANWRKRLLPIYDVFDEVRYFESGGAQPVAEFGGRRIGVTICEDLWSHEEMLGHPLYAVDPARELVAAGADVLFNISASPYFLGKHALRVKLLEDHARQHHVPLLYANQVGGNDEQLFDGASFVVNADGALVGQARAFDEDLLLVDLDDLAATRREPYPEGEENLHAALVMGLRDYVHKCGFRSVVIGLSGGIDSALVAELAVAALGKENVRGIGMPSRYSSDHSVADARQLAQNLGIEFTLIAIDPMHRAFEDCLTPQFDGRAPDITEENLQARSRGVILMAFSNKFGSLLLTTGNKSELAVGYCTLYGDMAGGLAVISDVPKTMVYRLARFINERAGHDVIPQNILDKPPSAELKPNQTDQDTLPPYDVLDEILRRYDEQLQSVDEIIAAGFDAGVVRDVIRKMNVSEYKRQQAAQGLKVTSRAFGFGRRMPIAAKAEVTGGNKVTK